MPSGSLQSGSGAVIATDQLPGSSGPVGCLSARGSRLGRQLTYRMRLQPSEPGWLDMALAVPLMDITRAREQLGWSRDAQRAGRRRAAGRFPATAPGLDTPPLEPGGAGSAARCASFSSGVGARLG